MARLTYWVARCTDDSSIYSFRAKTKKECSKFLAEHWRPTSFEAPKKVTVEYRDAFDLMDACLTTENAGGWEY